MAALEIFHTLHNIRYHNGINIVSAIILPHLAHLKIQVILNEYHYLITQTQK